MKRFFSLLLIITFASHFGTNAAFAQKRAKPKEVIVVEFLYPNQVSFGKSKILVSDTLKEYLDFGGGGVSECGISEDPECAKNYSSYNFSARAFASGKNQTRIKLQIETTYGNEDCPMQKRTFIVYRHLQTKIRLKCGVTLIARYGLETEETN